MTIPAGYSLRTMTTEEDSIEQASNARREMLKALRAAKEFSSMPDGDALPSEDKPEDAVNGRGEMSVEDDLTEHDTDKEVSEETGDKGLRMKFRNYLPHDKKLQQGKLPAPVLPKFEDPVADDPPPPTKTEDPFVNIAPKKPNWDLRRDVQKKLDKLERRTQKTLNQLMQDQEREREAVEEEVE